MKRKDTVWQSADLAVSYLEGVRGAIPLADEQLRLLLTLVQAAVPNLRSFLDLGCGDGVLGHTLLDAYPEASGVFVDFSAPMLDAARNRLGEAASNHTFLYLDYGDPSWTQALDGRRFDAVVSGYSIHHQPDERKQALYREIFDLLHPDGIFLNLEHVASASPWGEHVFDEYFIDALYAHHAQGADAPSRKEIAQTYYNRPDKQANILVPVFEQCRWLRQIGYVQVDCFFKVFELALFGGRKPGVL